MRILLRNMKYNRLSIPQFFRFCVQRKYTKEHEWIALESDIVITQITKATIGITEFAQSELGEIVHVELPKVGTAYNEGDSLVWIFLTQGAIESVKTAADVYNPIAGVVHETNEKLTRTPKLLNTHPYSQGWYAKLKVDPTHAAAHLSKFFVNSETLMNEEDYLKLVESSKK